MRGDGRLVRTNRRKPTFHQLGRSRAQLTAEAWPRQPAKQEKSCSTSTLYGQPGRIRVSAERVRREQGEHVRSSAQSGLES